MEKKELIGLSKEELTAELVNIGEKAFRAKQLWQWIYFRGETDFDKMTNISKDLREKLKQHFSISRPKIITEQISTDKTQMCIRDRRKAYLIMECQDEEIRDDEAYYFHFDDIHKRVIRDVIYQQRVINHEVYYPKSFSFEAVVQKGPYMAACFKKTIVMPSPGEWMPEESFRVQ